jgi:hypothetical protein
MATGVLRDPAMKKAALRLAQGGFRHHFGRSSASQPVPQRQISAGRRGGKVEFVMRQTVPKCLIDLLPTY